MPIYVTEGKPRGLAAAKDVRPEAAGEKNIAKRFNFSADIPYWRPGLTCHLEKDLRAMSIQVTHTFSAATRSTTIHVINTHGTAGASGDE